jgi:hypothetical protein
MREGGGGRPRVGRADGVCLGLSTLYASLSYGFANGPCSIVAAEVLPLHDWLGATLD